MSTARLGRARLGRERLGYGQLTRPAPPPVELDFETTGLAATGELAELDFETLDPTTTSATLSAQAAPTEPAISVGDELYERVQPLAYADQRLGYPLRALCRAIGRMAQPIEDLARDTDEGPGWSAVVDVDRCPDRLLFLPAWLTGTRYTRGLSPAALRQAIRDRDHLDRGTPPAITRAAQRHLTGTRTVVLIERDGSPYHTTIVTRPAETPDAAGLRHAVLAQKPAGHRFSFLTSDQPLINEGTRTIDAAPARIDTATRSDVT